MADVEHSALTGASLHEPKGVAAATADKVYVSDGAGSGEWTNLFQYGCLFIDEGDAKAISTIGTTPQTMPFTNAGVDAVVDADGGTETITTTNAGVYFVAFNITFEIDAAPDAGTYEFKLVQNGSTTDFGSAITVTATGRERSTGFTALVSAAAADAFTIEIESDEVADTDDITVYTCTFSMFKVG